MEEKEKIGIREKIYNMSNSYLPLDMFYNDIRDLNASNINYYDKEFAYKDLEKIADFIIDLQEDNKQLKQQLENTIVPKFKFDEECVVIMFGSYHFHRFIAQVKDDLCLTQPYNDIEEWYYVKPEMVFKTLEEAKAKLKEIKGEQ